MDKLDNIQVFAFCVAEAMDQLYVAFPIPTELSSSRVSEVYGPSREDSEPRIVQLHDADYTDLLPKGFNEYAGLSYATGEEYLATHNAEEGNPFQYWTDAQRFNIRHHRARAREAESIYKATVAFLLREGYIKDVPPPGLAKALQPPFVLTSKGFAHLNKKFEGHTIRDEFHYGTAKKVLKIVTGAGEVTSAAHVKRWAMETVMPIIRIKVRLLIALVLLSLTAVASANEVDSVNTVSRLSPSEFTSIPAQVRKSLIELDCTIPQVSYLSKGKSNVISGSFAKRGQMDYAVLCSRNGMSHIQVVWGGQARCESELQMKEDSIFLQQEDSGKMEYSRALGVIPHRAIVKLSPADNGSKLSAPYHEAIQDAFAEKGSSIFYCEKGKWHELEGAD